MPDFKLIQIIALIAIMGLLAVMTYGEVSNNPKWDPDDPKWDASLDVCRMEMAKRVTDALASIETLDEWPDDVPTLQELLSHKAVLLRWKISGAIARYARGETCTLLKRRQLVEILSAHLGEHNVPKWLLEFKREDFNAASKEMITKEFKRNPTREIIFLADLAGIESARETIQVFASEPLEKARVGRQWAARLVFAREGNKQSIKEILEAIRREKEPSSRVLLLSELQYVPQPEIVEYLKEYLDSNDRLEPINTGDMEGPLHAQFAAVILAKMLKGFPVVKEHPNYTEEELNTCRQWMSHQQEWQFMR